MGYLATDKQQTHGGSGLKAALHQNARITGGSGFVSVALGRCPFAKPQGTVHSLHGTAPIYRRALYEVKHSLSINLKGG